MRMARIHCTVAYALFKAFDIEHGVVSWSKDSVSNELKNDVSIIKQRVNKHQHNYYLVDKKGGTEARELINKHCKTSHCMIWLPVPGV